jgi:hypothetical protein
MINRKVVVLSGAFACIAGCVGDFLSLFVLGSKFPGYSHLHDTMSSLGSSASPVSDTISAWWVLLGILIIIFAFGFKAAYSPGDKYVKIAFWLIVLYGLGEGMGSGFFKADLVDGSFTISFFVHDILGSFGIIAILILPIIMQKIVQFSTSPGFIKFLRVVLILELLFFVLFSFRFLGSKNNIINEIIKCKGLWQRLFVLVYYICLINVAFKMVRKTIREKDELN